MSQIKGPVPPFVTSNKWQICGNYSLRCDCGRLLEGLMWEELGDPETDLLFTGNTAVCQCGANWLISEGYQGGEAYRLKHLEKSSVKPDKLKE